MCAPHCGIYQNSSIERYISKILPNAAVLEFYRSRFVYSFSPSSNNEVVYLSSSMYLSGINPTSLEWMCCLNEIQAWQQPMSCFNILTLDEHILQHCNASCAITYAVYLCR